MMAPKKPTAPKKKKPAQPKEKPAKKAMNTSNKKSCSKKVAGDPTDDSKESGVEVEECEDTGANADVE